VNDNCAPQVNPRLRARALHIVSSSNSDERKVRQSLNSSFCKPGGSVSIDAVARSSGGPIVRDEVP
jgi:hypothetical protein